MPRRARVDWDAVLAAAPHGLILVRDLLALGVPSSTIAFRCRNAGSPWWRPLTGLVALARGTLTAHQSLLAALLYAGEDALVTGRAACRLFGLKQVPDDDAVHVLIPHATRRRSQRFVIVERTERLPAARTRRGIRCAPVHRAALDAARNMVRVDDIRSLLCEVVQRRMTTVTELRAELEQGSGRGTSLVRSVIVELEHGVRSAPEAWCREVVAEMVGFPEVRWNANVHRADGSFLVCADGFVEEVALAIEVHSFAHHGDLVAFDDTMRRQAMMVAAGVVVAVVTPRRLRADREGFKRDLWAALDQARARPGPPIFVHPITRTEPSSRLPRTG